MSPTPQHLVIMGVSGSGKTTISTLLSEHLGWIAAEADEFHPESNIAKMSSGTPLTDEDRWPWLASIREWMDTQAENGRSTIVTCSALKHSYRDVLATASGDVHFVHLNGDAAVLGERMKTRSGHFMPASLLPSQMSTLEPLAEDEQGVVVDILKPPGDIVSEILTRLNLPAN
ncbi:gluconokinase [Arthrobacter sp. zg-ZUI100]|uniref:Gluconokinase n=1 Tax=Arthrobacter jiangjiafuii TaxID=2817475 RepID=A0A975M525_9MICC|nr:gluconokinase [Arthrobacter jiangjiafuii]MBP3035706.1 gluconokinase [Arthrobacter jiangjiafuii]MBP3042099.1 gluconokinase [Arthrobacter jiangjiafuii]QWC10123.1 gluconokinase [Arthrobacter jiangjiafuii]